MQITGVDHFVIFQLNWIRWMINYVLMHFSGVCLVVSSRWDPLAPPELDDQMRLVGELRCSVNTWQRNGGREWNPKRHVQVFLVFKHSMFSGNKHRILPEQWRELGDGEDDVRALSSAVVQWSRAASQAARSEILGDCLRSREQLAVSQTGTDCEKRRFHHAFENCRCLYWPEGIFTIAIICIIRTNDKTIKIATTRLRSNIASLRCETVTFGFGPSVWLSSKHRPKNVKQASPQSIKPMRWPLSLILC